MHFRVGSCRTDSEEVPRKRAFSGMGGNQTGSVGERGAEDMLLNKSEKTNVQNVYVSNTLPIKFVLVNVRVNISKTKKRATL